MTGFTQPFFSNAWENTVQRRISRKNRISEAFSKAVWLHQGFVMARGLRRGRRGLEEPCLCKEDPRDGAMTAGARGNMVRATRGQRAERRLLFDGRVAMQLEIATGRYVTKEPVADRLADSSRWASPFDGYESGGVDEDPRCCLMAGLLVLGFYAPSCSKKENSSASRCSPPIRRHQAPERGDADIETKHGLKVRLENIPYGSFQTRSPRRSWGDNPRHHQRRVNNFVDLYSRDAFET
jgi:hypothetical protein